MISRFRECTWRLVPGGLTALMMGILLSIGALQPLEYLAYNALFQLRGEQPWDDRIVLVAIDDESIRELERFPWPRRYYTQLITLLTEANPSVIGLDLLLSESSPEDGKLAQAMANDGRVVLPEAKDINGLPLQPVPQLRDAAIATGHIFSTTDLDGITRRVDLSVRDSLHFGAIVTQVYSLVRQPVPLPNLTEPLWINWPGSARKLRQYSVVDVLARRVSPKVFENKIVIVGVTATGFDTLLTPFNQNPPITGVYLHAAVINNLLQQNALKTNLKPWWLWVMLLLTPGFSLFLSLWRTELQLLIGSGSYVLWMGLALICLHANYWIPVALPSSLFVSTTIAVALCERLRMNRFLQDHVQRIWQSYGPELMQQSPSLVRSWFSTPSRQPTSLRAITQLASLAEALGRAHATQNAISQSLSVGLFAVNQAGIVCFCNTTAAEWIGLRLGDPLLDRWIPDWYSEAQWEQDLFTLRRGRSVMPSEVQRGDRWYCITLQPLSYSQPFLLMEMPFPSLRGIVLIVEEITSRKQVEKNLEQQVRELEHLSRLKDEFLSTVSHELRTPITNMRLALQMIRLAQSDIQRNQYLQILEQECLREKELINDLLDLQDLEARQDPITRGRLNLNLWLPEIVDRFQAKTHHRQQHLSLDLPPDLPLIYVEISSLERILVELLNNAYKYTPALGNIWVRTYVRDARHVAIAVCNNGIEIPADEIPKIFEKFYRIPRQDPWQQGGTGLGLALVKRLIDRLQATIRVESSQEETCFLVEIPITPTYA